MIASRPDAVLPLLLATLLGMAACRSPGALPAGAVLERDVHFARLAPDVTDRTAAQVAAAALASDREAAHRALARLQAVETVLRAADEPPTGLVGVATDLVNATLDDARAYRTASRELIERDDLDPALRARLEQASEDDPLRLADARIRDARMIEFGRAFNAVAEPVGRSILNTTMAPYRFARALARYAMAVYVREPLPLQRRQALAHWKRFIARNRDTPEARRLAPKVREAEARWHLTQRNRAVRVAERALERDENGLALVYADRALHHAPEDARASDLRDEAARRLTAERARRRESVAEPLGAPADVVPDGARPLALALLRPGGDVDGAAGALLEAERGGPLDDEARFALALDADERASWDRLEALADRDVRESNMARHAEALLESPRTHPYRAFRRARSAERRERLAWLAVGPWAKGMPERGVPWPFAWLVDLPAVGESVFGMPLRLIQLPWAGRFPSSRDAAVHARRYLAHAPDGARAPEVRAWLEDFESDRGNWIGALDVASHDPGAAPEHVAELREKAAAQALSVAEREERRDMRWAMLRHVVQEFPHTAAGRAAGERARSEVAGATAHRVRLTRAFLEENPRLAGPHGLALAPGLLDEDLSNGELHPEGVALVGGREVELSLVGAGRDEDDPPTRVHQRLSEERFARLVSELEEVSFRNALVDPDETIEANAGRDAFFERARLGLADDPDERSTARAEYTYRGMRERYGMVRSRESILPFELVVQGSLTSLDFGAFPRMREPRQTPDAFLYR